eukprot:1236165-Amphidinium_carterae.1
MPRQTENETIPINRGIFAIVLVQSKRTIFTGKMHQKALLASAEAIRMCAAGKKRLPRQHGNGHSNAMNH